MAGHYMDCAANTDLQASKKLVLMCIADDADKQSRIGRVGLDAIRKWSGLGRSRALEVIKDLVDEGYLARHAAGRIGRQAEFVVFPGGCCGLHGPVAGYVPDEAPEAAVEQASERGSGGPDPLPETPLSTGSGTADPAVDIEGPEEGPIEGPAQTGPPLEQLPIKTPPTPAGRGDRAKVCSHGAGACRRCGTNPRALRVNPRAAVDDELAALVAARAAVPHCGHPDCNPANRWREPDAGRAHRCPTCHPDVVVGPAPVRPLALAGAASSPRSRAAPPRF